MVADKWSLIITFENRKQVLQFLAHYFVHCYLPRCSFCSVSLYLTCFSSIVRRVRRAHTVAVCTAVYSVGFLTSPSLSPSSFLQFETEQRTGRKKKKKEKKPNLNYLYIHSSLTVVFFLMFYSPFRSVIDIIKFVWSCKLILILH